MVGKRYEKTKHNYSNFTKHDEYNDVCMYCDLIVPTSSRQQHNATKKHYIKQIIYYKEIAKNKNKNIEEEKDDQKLKCIPCDTIIHKEYARFHVYDVEHKRNKMKYFNKTVLYCECGRDFDVLDALAYHLLSEGHRAKEPYLKNFKGSYFYLGKKPKTFLKLTNKHIMKPIDKITNFSIEF